MMMTYSGVADETRAGDVIGEWRRVLKKRRRELRRKSADEDAYAHPSHAIRWTWVG